MRYLATLGFNTKQWWIYDNEKDVFIDPPIEVLEQLENLSNDDAETKLEEIANSKPFPDWLFDKDYWYDGDI